MTKEITKAFILQQLQDKLGLREWEREDFLFSERVIPIYNIEQHLGEWITLFQPVAISSATGFVFFTVPEDEEWVLSTYDVIFTGAGAFTVSGVYIDRKNSAVGNMFYLDLTAGQTISYIHVLNNHIILNAGDTVNVNVDSYTSTQTLWMYLDALVTKIR